MNTFIRISKHKLLCLGVRHVADLNCKCRFTAVQIDNCSYTNQSCHFYVNKNQDRRKNSRKTVCNRLVPFHEAFSAYTFTCEGYPGAPPIDCNISTVNNHRGNPANMHNRTAGISGLKIFYFVRQTKEFIQSNKPE